MWDFWESHKRASQIEEWQCLGNDPDGIEVYLSQEHWITHILDRHKDMEQKWYLMFRAIMCPIIRTDGGETDKGFPIKKAFCFSRPSKTKIKKVYYLEVVIKYLIVEELGRRYVGLVSTAHELQKDREI